MGIIPKATSCIILLMLNLICYSQGLKKANLTKQDVDDGVVLKYQYIGDVEGGVALRLFKNQQYRYDLITSGYEVFSSGIWTFNDSEFILNSFLQKEDVPIKINYLDSISSPERIHKIGMQIPVNLKGERLSDSRIFLNDDSAYAFPYFDTIVGTHARIDRIKVAFGNGFESKWIPLTLMPGKQLLVIAQIDFPLTSYLVFQNKRFKKDLRTSSIDDK